MEELKRAVTVIITAAMLLSAAFIPAGMSVMAEDPYYGDTAVSVGSLVVGVYGNDNYSIPDLDILKPYGLVEMSGTVGTNNSGVMPIEGNDALIFRTADNSPFWFDAQFVGTAVVGIFASPDNEVWTKVEYTQVGSENSRGQYYAENIGVGNSYIKVVLGGIPWDNFVRLYGLRFDIGFGNTEVPVGDIVVGAYGNDNYSIPNLDILKPYGLLRTTGNFGTNNNGVLSGNQELIFRTAENSPFWFDAQFVGGGAISLYASRDGESWTETEYLQIGSENSRGQYYTSGTGKRNTYVKLVLGGAPWDNFVRLYGLKYDRGLGNTEVPVGDIAVGAYGNDKNDITELDALKPYGLVGMSGIVGTNNNGLIPISGNDALIFKTAEDSPLWFDAQLEGSGTISLFASFDNETWTEISYTQIGSENSGGQYYIGGIGKGNTYVKLVLGGTPGDNTVRLFSLKFNSGFGDTLVPVGDIVVGTYGNDKYDLPNLDILKPYGLVRTEKADADTFKTNNNGLLFLNAAAQSLIFKVADNSPVWIDANLVGSAEMKLYASSDDEAYTQVSFSKVSEESDRCQYYIDGIGKGNRYVKLEFVGWSWEHLVRLFNLKFNCASESGESDGDAITTDTKLNFVSGYSDAVSKAYKCSYDLIQILQGGIGGTDTPNSYIIYKVEKNSPIIATFKLFANYTAGRPEFYASLDGENWSKLEMTTDVTLSGMVMVNYSTDGIGKENRYVKIVFSNVELGAVWYSDMQSLEYNASTEIEDLPKPDTTIDFIANGKADLDRAFRIWNFDISPAAGYENAAYATKNKKNYIILNTADNSPFVMNMRVHDSALNGSVTLLTSDDPNSTAWQQLDVTRVEPKNGGYNTWSYNATSIGKGNTYVKIVLSNSSAWAFCIENISYSAGEHIGRDDSGYVEPDPDDNLPKTDTALDFLNQYNAALNQAYMFSPDLLHIWQGGLGGSNTPDSYIVYKVDKNSPIIATFKLFANDTAGRPEFYASSDGKHWSLLEMKTDEEISGTCVVRFISEGIGKENRYIKVVISNAQLGAVWYSDFQAIAFNANTEPSPYDLTVNFVNDATALARMYTFTPNAAFDQLLNTGLLLTVDYLSGQKNLEHPRAVVAIKNGSGLMAQFKVSKFAEALDMFPRLYASKDSKNWELIEDYEIFLAGMDTDYKSYRLMIDSLDPKYEFVAFEYPQTEDYTGMTIEELNDYIPDCLNAGIILTSLSFTRSGKYTSLVIPDGNTDTGYSSDDDYDFDFDYDYGDYDNDGYPDGITDTGDKTPLALNIFIAISAAGFIIAVQLKAKFTKKAGK